MITNRTAFARLAAGTVLAATTMLGGCATDGGASPAKYASKAEAALAKGQTGKGVTLAEQAVLAAPRDATARALLGAAYLKAGRFASATEAYDAALELGDEAVPTVLGLALSETAQGHDEAALELLNDWRDVIPASDLGLAFALAGNAPRGIAVLTEALRGGDTTVKARQNLAFAYALAGQWREARLMLAQDVPADQINDRIAQWAQLAVPGAGQARVASLLGVPLTGDTGQPAALALSNFPSAEALAMEAAQTPPAAPEAAPVEVAQAEVTLEAPLPVGDAVSAPVRLASLDQPASTPADTVVSDTPQFAPAVAVAPVAEAATFEPIVQAEASVPVVQDVTPVPVAQTLAVLPAQFRPVGRPRIVGNFVPHGNDRAKPGKGTSLSAPKAAAKPVSGGSHWVQLGSYEDPAIAKEGWGKFIRRTPALKGYQATTTTATVNGTPVWRVAATGFASYGDAASMCRMVKQRGGACLVVTAPKLPRGLGGGGISARR